jgi:ADP-heptose:LPS heptosyltransferase
MVRRVLVFRLGSLGDTAAVLPCFHLIERAFPNAERRLLTNLHSNSKASTILSVLGDSGFMHGTIAYPADATRSWSALRRLRRDIRAFRPDVLVYLLEQRHSRAAVLRDCAFFLACGIRRIIGAPLSRDRYQHRWLSGRDRYENQIERLGRCLAPLGDTRSSDRDAWDLRLTAAERERADTALASLPADAPLIACCPGTKIDAKDWTEENWAHLLTQLAVTHASHAIAFIGAADERERSERLRACWPGPSANLCGDLTPRESAAAIARAVLYLGHDTGPMHLAAAAGVPCVAIFSARNKPGEWYPHGDAHRVLYHRTDCFDCHLERCDIRAKECILSITAEEVLAEVRALLPRAA